jgi:hypothetical protein
MRHSMSSHLSMFVLAILLLVASACTSLKQPAQNQPYVEFTKPNQLYNYIEYSVEKQDVLYYLNNNTNGRTYLLWCVNAEQLVCPVTAELPGGYSFQKVTYPTATKFNLHYNRKWVFIMDNHYNVYVRIH